MEKKQSARHGKSLTMLFDVWLNKTDEKDRALAPDVRKGKWIMILMAFFLLFASSFIWLPVAKFVGTKINTPAGNACKIKEMESGKPTFEMPVDSFENQIKENLHENLSKKK